MHYIPTRSHSTISSIRISHILYRDKDGSYKWALVNIDTAPPPHGITECALLLPPCRLSKINESLARKVQARNEYDKTIQETEAAYMKILESSQTLLHVLKRETVNLTKKKQTYVHLCLREREEGNWWNRNRPKGCNNWTDRGVSCLFYLTVQDILNCCWRCLHWILGRQYVGGGGCSLQIGRAHV